MILKETIDLKNLNFFSNLVNDYSLKNKKLAPFISSFPSEKSIVKQLKNRKLSNEIRKDLVSVLKKQYKKTNFLNSNFKKANNNIEQLISQNTYTITAGHQLSLFANPLFLIYKIVNIINLSSRISKITKKNIIPIFWLASEDHDFEEIKSLNLLSNKYDWNKKNINSAVGSISTKKIDLFIENIFNSLGSYPHKKDLKKILVETYTKNENLSRSIRSLLTFFFGKHGLVVLDPNDAILKNHFKKSMKLEVMNQCTFNLVSSQTNELSKDYKTIINPRKLNLFYFIGKKRLRIVKKEKTYYLIDNEKKWSQKQLLDEIELFPERFSPNVILRTLYQETVLPNIVYVGGPTEISYWLQFKSLFSHMKINFPILILRSGVLNVNSKHSTFLTKNKIKSDELFFPLDQFLSRMLYKKSKINLLKELSDFTHLSKSINKKTMKIDSSLNQHSLSIVKKIENDLKKLEKKIIKYQKKDHIAYIKFLTEIHSSIYHEKIIQERSFSFFHYYLNYGDKFFDILLEKLNCLESGYIILKGF